MSMATMARFECATYAREIRFAQWVESVQQILGRKLSQVEYHGIAWDLFADGCDAANAATEIEC